MIGCPPLSFGFVRRGTSDYSALGVSSRYTRLSYGYRLDATSTASVVLPASECLIDDVRAGTHELVVHREGSGVAWLGVVTALEERDGVVTCSAQDLSWWLGVRRLRRSHDSTATAVKATDLATAIIDDALERDNTMRLTRTVAYPGPLVKRDVRAKTYALSALQELGQSSLDWMVIGRTLTLWGESAPRSPVGSLTNDDVIGFPGVAHALDTRGSLWAALGASAALDDGSYAEIEEVAQSAELIATIGLIEREVREPDITDRPSLARMAAANLTRSTTGAPVAATLNLRPTSGVEFAGVRPGTVYTCDLRGQALSTRGTLRVTGWDEVDAAGGERTMTLALGNEAA